MHDLTSEAKFFLALARAQSLLYRRFDAGLGGISFNWFIIMYHLSRAEGERLRRIDLADKLGLTASGVTRLLGPMEKIGLVRSEPSAHDARVSIIALAPGGKRKLQEAIEDLEVRAEELIPEGDRSQLAGMADLMNGIAARAK
ncbi:MAG TPA: MarR family transcriptional regulator [Candidatus Binatia bacterium]|nr:MarR family transcriptional regulator [Candidatus Binatia bacterium]